MISVTRLNGSTIHLNAELISTVESHHDTVVTLVDGKTCVITDSAEDVVAKVITYRALVIAQAEQLITEHSSTDGAEEHDRHPSHLSQPHLVVLRPTDGRAVTGER